MKAFDKYCGVNIQEFSAEDYAILHQTAYAEEILREFTANPLFRPSFKRNSARSVPLDPGTLLNDPHAPRDSSLPSLLPFIGKCRHLIDGTRPDLLAALGILSESAHEPTPQHYQAARHFLSYLSGDLSRGIKVGGKDKNVRIFGFCDAASISKGDSKSRLGACWFDSLDSGAFHAVSKKDNVVSHHSTESELRALDLFCRWTIVFREIFEALGYKQDEPTVVYVDNNSAIAIAQSLRIYQRIAHMNKVINYVRQCINDRIIQIEFIPGELNVADILTKALPGPSFAKHQDSILNGFKNKPVPKHSDDQFTVHFAESLV
jgi:hypothetical protein